MKKIKNFVLFPVLLGGVCLVCGGAVAALNYGLYDRIVANGTIKITKAIDRAFVGNQGVTLIFDRNSEDEKLSNPDVKVPFDEHIQRFYMVKTATGKDGYAYDLTTDRGYSGYVEFLACIEGSSLIGLTYISGDEDTLGINAVNTLSAYISGGNHYTAGEDFSSFVVAAGASAQKTFPALLKSINVALGDVGNRLSFEFYLNTTVTKKETTFDSVTYTVETSPGEGTDDFDSTYKSLTGEFTYTYSVLESSYTLAKINITGSPATSEEDYGAAILSGTAEDPFTAAFVTPAVSGNGVKTSTITANTAALSLDTRYITPTSKALTTTYTLYTMIYESAKSFANFDKMTNDVAKISDGKYRARFFTVGTDAAYGYTDIQAMINAEKTAFTEIEYIQYGAVPMKGMDNFGMDIVDGNTSSGNAKRDEFVKNYVKIPAEGLSFAAIVAAVGRIDDLTIGTGATHTAEGYLTALNMIVTFVKEGN